MTKAEIHRLFALACMVRLPPLSSDEMTEAVWEAAERRDPAKHYIDVPAYNRDTYLGWACFIAMPILVILWCWWNLTTPIS